MTTPLRQKMMEDLQLHGLSGRTQALYVLAVQQGAEHYHKSPEQITEAELRAYFLYLLNEKRVRPDADRGPERGQVFLRVYVAAAVGNHSIGACAAREKAAGRPLHR
jgi:hypothetical protein